MKLKTLDRLLVAHVVVGTVASFVMPPLSAACMGGAIYLLRKRDSIEMAEAMSTIVTNPLLMKALRDTALNTTNREVNNS